MAGGEIKQLCCNLFQFQTAKYDGFVITYLLLIAYKASLQLL